MESLITNLDLFVLLKSESTSFNHEVLFSAVVSRIGNNLSAEDRVTLKEFCRIFTRAALQRWQKSNRFLDRFRRLYENWLQANMDWPSCVQSLVNQQPTVDEIPRAHSVSQEPSTSSSVGTMTKKSRKLFEDLGSIQKKRRSDDLIGKDSSELAYTAAARLEKEGHEDIASVIEYILKLISKWGFDGASNQSRYKQKIEGEQDDSSIFMTSLVPLKLTDGDNTLWNNPKPKP
ncbi:unnamed protein product [Arctia plantaginis]|uniref:Uncharacterized protein n=1 Tax=Arctia plantaginis TaxID=874455 RepID=A0A8S1AU03_ARCPL|nr:unnamed protein product [Arctia plantaginis]